MNTKGATTADMFGRRPHPVLELAIKIEKAESSRNQLFFYVRLGIRNQGRGAARQPAFFVSWEQKAVYKSTGPGGLGPTTINYYREGFESTYIGGADDIIHAGTCLQVVELRGYVDLDKLNSPPQRGAYPLTLDVELHCIGGSSKEYHETITSERILQDLGLWRSAWDEEGEG